MQVLYAIMIVAGVAGIGFGFWASYYTKKPWDIVGAISLPISLIVALLGVLLTCVPNFFKG